MASGADITVSGGVDMKLVNVGDVIDDLDYNKPNDNIDLLLGTPAAVSTGTFTLSSTYGYNQGGTPEANASVGDTIIATGSPGAFKDLQDQVQQLQTFLNKTVTPVDVGVGDTITASDWNVLMNAVKDCWDDRFTAGRAGASTEDSSSYIVDTDGSFENSISNEITYTFSSATAARAFFNGNGTVGVTISRTGGSTSQINDAWDAAFLAVGDVQLTYNDTVAGSGSTYDIGFYELTTTYQKIHDKFSGDADYSGDYMQVDAKVNNQATPTVLTLRVTIVDAPDGGTDNSPDGTFTINGRSNFPDVAGTSYSFAGTFSSVVAGAITGS